MYGESFKERHKEWFKESLALMYKSVPWMLILTGIVYGIYYAVLTLTRSAGEGTVASFFASIVYVVFLFFLVVLGPLAISSFSIMHRMDQGHKNDPVTLFYFILHDREMWKQSFKADVKDYFGLIIYVIAVISTFQVIEIMNPSDAKEVPPSAAAIAAKIFWEEHRILYFISDYLSLFIICTLPYLFLHEAKSRVLFNTFMLANSYKNVDECKNDAQKAKSKIGKYRRTYVLAPQVCLMILIFLPFNFFPVADFIVTVIETLIVLWAMHMNYIIGRDYYIGPPPKKQKQESFDRNYQTA